MGAWGVLGIARNDARCFSFYKTFFGALLGIFTLKRTFSLFVFLKAPVVPLHDPDHGGPAQCSRTTRSVVHK